MRNLFIGLRKAFSAMFYKERESNGIKNVKDFDPAPFKQNEELGLFDTFKEKISTASLRNPRGKRMTSIHTGREYPLEKDCASFYGTPGDTDNLVTIDLPYEMYLAWDPRVKTRTMSCHRLVAKDLLGIFEDVLDYYGIDGIKRLKLNEYGGCYNKRKIRGGRRWSTHAWGVAVDLYTTKNRLRWKHPRAYFSRDEYRPFWRIVKEHGAYSLGVNRNYDWQHFQFCAR